MASVEIPKRLPLLFIQEDVLLPGSSIRIPVTRSRGANLVKSRLLSRNTLASSIVGVITLDDLNESETNNQAEQTVIGTAAFVLQVTSPWPRANVYNLYVSGLCRFSVDKLVMEDPYPVAVVTQLDYMSMEPGDKITRDKLVEETRKLALMVLKNVDFSSIPGYSLEVKKAIENATAASLPDIALSFFSTSYQQKKEVLYTMDLKERLYKVKGILERHLEGDSSTKDSSIPKSQVYVVTVPKQTKMVRMRPRDSTDSSDSDGSINEIEELQNKIVKANMPVDVNKVVMKDLQRLKKMGPFSPEHSVLRSYLEFVVELPWSISSSETIDILKARKDLDAEHYGMQKVKKRVLEYLAVRQLKPSVRGPILCFVGPPGVGKTSIGRSIAHTLNRQFQRISLGGVSNQSDVRGHRRTYIGAMPGRIIQAIKNAGVNNPVILLDEIDKMTNGVRGDPAAALLEVLDPLQNHSFFDHYLNIPFDLSQVTFIATANLARHIPIPLLDRMETIHITGYTLEEKVLIAKGHLLPKQLDENGLNSDMLRVPDDTLKRIISCYTSEAGVRGLERKLGAVCRAFAVKVAENGLESLSLPTEINTDTLEDILGPPVYSEDDVSSRVAVPGVAVGLSLSKLGGHTLVVEARKLPGGEGQLILTGQLGEVMRESANLAFNWVRGIAQTYGLIAEGEELMNDCDVHIHFPAGGVSKDGPSAGITVATALVSLFANTPLIPGLAMTGELTLRGVVLPVGGVRDKVLAAHRAGLRKVILPKLCIKDLIDIPQSVKDDMTFLFVRHMEEVIDAAFDGIIAPVSQSRAALQSRL